MKGIFILLLTVIFCPTLIAQTTIRAGADFKAKGIMSTRGGISNGSDKTDLTLAHIILTGTNQTLSTTSPLTVQGLTIEGGGTKTIQGDVTVSRDLLLTQGILTAGTGRILYTGTTPLSGTATSYVNGILFQRGTGTRFFPVGSGSTYLPMSLNNIEDGSAEIGVSGFTAGVNLSLPSDLSALAGNRHWQVDVRGGTFRASSASLYVPGSSVDASPRMVVVEADAGGGTALNLGGGITGDFVTSFNPATRPILTIGIAEKVDLRIMDLITPFTADNINDRLKILNIEYTYENKVTLLDRWGVTVHEWSNFRNYDDPSATGNDNYDFTKLSPGNYICVLEYKLSADSPREKLNQMITVLKGN